MNNSTIAEAIHQTQTGPSTSVYSHPYYAADRKGKGREIEAQLARIREAKNAIALAQAALGRMDGDWGKLARSLKEIAGHSQTLLHFPSSLPQASTSRPIAPTPQIHLAPAELIDAVARGLGLQVFTEDSQFGLLKQSLAIAGSCFVIDIDLETDAVPEESAAAVATDASTTAASATGRVRMSKLEANHVTADGGNEASPHVKRVLEALVEGYIEARYAEASGHKQERERGKRVQRCIDQLKGALGQVKELDGLQGQHNLFAALEQAAAKVQALVAVTALPEPCIIPSFALQPSAAVFSIRPSKPNGQWLLQSTPAIPVPRNWIDPDLPTGDRYNGGIKMENLWNRDGSGSDMSAFPYSASFSHRGEDGTEQAWRLAKPGSDGYLVNQIVLNDLEGGLDHVRRAFQRQVVLQCLFQQVFTAFSVAQSTEDAEDADIDLDELLNGPTSMPLDVQCESECMEIRLPLPYAPPTSETILLLTITPINDPPLIHIRVGVSPDDAALRDKLQTVCNAELSRGKGGQQLVSLIDLIALLEQALRV